VDPVNSSNSPPTVSAAGVAFDPLLAGTVHVTATIPGFTTLPAGTVHVTVTP
jgi:hypothetical protein